MKKVLSIILSLVLVIGTTIPALAEENVNATITVYLSVSENGEFVTSPVTNEKMADIPVEISYFDLAEYGLEQYYRFEADSFENGGDYINTNVVETPTLMHLFIKAVEEYYLGEKYIPEEDSEILSFTGAATSAYASRFWNHDSNFTYLVDGKMPEKSAGWGASCDYVLLEDGMKIETGMFSSWDWATSGSVATFEEKELVSNVGGILGFSVKGNPLFFGGTDQVELNHDNVFVVKSSQLDWVNDETAEYIFESDENGIFKVRFDEPGEFYVSAVDVNVGSESASIAPAVCKVTVTEYEPLPEFNGYWTSFRGNENNMGIVDAKIPKSESRASLKWAEQYAESWMDNTTPPIIVEDELYFAKNNKVLRVSKEDGSLVAESEELAGNIGFGTTSITYGGGLFYVPIESGRIQALRADTLESVWVSETLGGQTITPVTYADGKVYCGTWSRETDVGNYFCLDVADDDTNQKTETKKCLWTIEHQGGFYWAGAYATENYVIFGSDDGEEEGTNGTSVLYSVKSGTGEVIDKIESIAGDIRSSIAYDSMTDRIYFTTKGGMFCKVKVNDDGTFAHETFEAFELSGASTVTPLVYDGLAYVGVTNSDQFENGGNGYSVIDVNVSPMKEVASSEVPGSVQSCALLTTAYEDNGWVNVYITYNNIPGGIFELEVKKTDETDSDGAAVVKLNSKEIFVPEDDMAQFCICSPICDGSGTIYYKNDSGYLMAVRRKPSSGSVGGSYGGNGSGGSGGSTAVEKDEAVKESETETTNESSKEAVTQEQTTVPDVTSETEVKTAFESKFADIKGHWAEEYINVLTSKGIINGKSETEFVPDDKVTRAEFVSLLYRLSGDAVEFRACFDDVKADDWYSDAVFWAVEKKITTGTSESLFSPDAQITREMAVVFIGRYLEYRGVSPAEESTLIFDDMESVSTWAVDSVVLMKNSGIVSGKENNRFMPQDNTTRAETAKILSNMIGVIEKNEK